MAHGIILNKDGAFQTSFKYRGPDLESSTESGLLAVTARLNNVLRRFGSGWALFFEAARREAAAYPACDFPDAVSWLADEERAISADEAAVRFESDYYLTLLWLPPEDLTGHAERALITRAKSEDAGAWRRRLEEFQQQAARTFDLLSTALPEIARLSDSETLSYLHDTISTKRHPVAVPELPVFLDAILADEPFTGGLIPMIGSAHSRTLTVLGYPASTLPGILDELNRQGFAYRWMTRFIAMDKAEKLLSKKSRHWAAKRKSVRAILRETMFNEPTLLVDNDADNKAQDTDAALQKLGSDLVSYGYAKTTVTVIHEDARIAEDQARLIERIINGRGFTIIAESLNAVEAWLGSLPGHPYANVRQPVLHTLNLAHMIPVSAVWAGDAWNRHLDGPALIEAQTGGSTPFRLNLHAGDVGHTMIAGSTGAGKSVLLALTDDWGMVANRRSVDWLNGRRGRLFFERTPGWTAADTPRNLWNSGPKLAPGTKGAGSISGTEGNKITIFQMHIRIYAINKIALLAPNRSHERLSNRRNPKFFLFNSPLAGS